MTRIAYQGAPGAYSQLAAKALYPGARVMALAEFVDVVRAVATGKAELGILPIRNSIMGVVAEASAALVGQDGLSVVNELAFPVQHCLLALPGADLRGIRWVESHPAALAQCGAWLGAQGLQSRPVADTAGAARAIAIDRDFSRAAIAGVEAAERYGLVVLAEDIADVADNITHFVVIATAASVEVAA